MKTKPILHVLNHTSLLERQDQYVVLCILVHELSDVAKHRQSMQLKAVLSATTVNEHQRDGLNMQVWGSVP